MRDRGGLLADYCRLREVSRSLHNRRIKQIPKLVLTSSAERLGLLSPGPGRHGKEVLLLEDEYEISVLMDYCLYHGRQGQDGRTVIDQAIDEAPPASGNDELLLLRAMQEARFSVFAVDEAVPGIGVHVLDLLRDEPLFLVDIGFSQTAGPGLVLAGNVIFLPALSMTTGAMLPVDRMILDDLLQQLPERFATATVGQFRQLSPHEQSELAACVIRACLAGGAASYVEPRDVKTGLHEPPLPHGSHPRAARRPPRNAPCPCGSGQKFKRCCGRP
jgi:SEC-C motif